VTSLTVSSAVTFSGITKVLDQGDFIIQNQADTTKQLEFNLSGQTTGKLLTLSSLLTTSQTLQVPNITATDTFATLGLAQTFSAVTTLSNATDATALGTGALVLSAGGLSVAGQIRLGGAITATGGITATNGVISSTLSSGTNSLSVTATSGQANLTLNSSTGQSAQINFQVAGANTASIFGNATNYFVVYDNTGHNALTYTQGTLGTAFWTCPLTTSATTSLLGAVVIGNGTAATSIGMGAGNINAGGTLTVGGATTINNTLTLGGATASPQLTIAPTGANDAIVFLNAPTGQVPRIRIGVAGTIQYNINSAGGTLNLADNVNSLTFFIYTPGVAGANFVTMPATLDATNSTTAGFVVSGGLAVAKAVNIGTTLTTGGNITTTSAGTITWAANSSGGNAGVVMNAFTGSTAFYRLQINGSSLYTMQGTTSNLSFVDNGTIAASVLQYTTTSSIATCSWTFPGTLAATSATAASVKFAGGVGINGALWVSSATLIATSTALTNNAAAQIATLTNGPTAGNPTKWIPINDNGTIRNIPCW
jgi:hypothetical protein